MEETCSGHHGVLQAFAQDCKFASILNRDWREFFACETARYFRGFGSVIGCRGLVKEVCKA